MSDEKVTEDQLDLFKIVIEILNDLEISYWVDQGSLLGIVRQNSFLPWDHDVDLGIWQPDYMKHKKEIHRILSDYGARITFLPYVTKIKYSKGDRKSIPVNIRLYHREGGAAYSEFWSYTDLSKKSDKENAGYLRNMNRSVKLRKFCQKTPSVKFFLSPLLGLNHLFFLYMKEMRETLKDRRVVFRVSEDYFLSLEKREVYGVNVLVPEDPESYIALKYGESWREPNKNWVWYTDDGGSYSIHYFKRSLFNRPRHFVVSDYQRPSDDLRE